ncbi:hypothetical protein QZJ86_06890 [Methylomonas montana]|uniref:hypothetical protein n=1 Tax=Methylomonas montana TaxID=3058963 RepID=UPI00265ACA33|nr:hypothetical protein [Methylomonas montana]WKJ91861.1 hypothetical protein QZJ86_06890 [Methylomonas montana]
MSFFVGIFSSIEFWKFALPLLGAIVAWFTNEWRKRIVDQYQRKESSYKELLHSLQGFYIGANNAEDLKSEFLNQLNIAWLYCPDDVIKKGYAFLDTVHTQKISSDTEKEFALGAFVAAIRTDLLSRELIRTTALSATDFKHLGVNKH